MFKTDSLALDRRSLFRLGGLSTMLAAGKLAAQDFGTGFTHGVASGEPGADRVLLWTRYVSADEVALQFELAEDAEFTRIVSGGMVRAHAVHDFCAKAWATGLEPGRWYYYRFIAPDGDTSCAGRTRTLPEGDVSRFRLGVFSCSNMGFGYFNAYAHATQADDIDCTLHLGDYFYEYPRGDYPSRGQSVPERILWPEHELVALADYRLRYATYRGDKDLRRLHQLYPMIAGWDDHESANDSWKDGAQNHQPESEGEWSVRKAAAMRAYREWMPVSDEPWAHYQVGNLATLYRLETRLTARAKQFSIGDIIKGKASPEAMEAALTAFREGSYEDASREMLGADQLGWLADGMAASRKSGTVWQVLVQQVLMGKLASPPELLEGASAQAPDYAKARLQTAALASKAGLPSNFDAWDGYPAARKRVLSAAQNAGANLISLAGDTHNAWAFDMAHGGEAAGIEFAVQGVTSPGLESYLRGLDPKLLARTVVAFNRQLQWADTSQRGYMAVELTPERASCEWRFVDTIRQRSTKLAATHRMSAAAGANRLDA
ncbi:MAG: alkaline phosphatase D family protein [Sphingomonadaceae bacterium]|nr:alkaline phosphatase D family protein [Sphingomonadaceae bacterium]